MNQKQFGLYLFRDHGCVHCGDKETAVPHHRSNRGMGGSKLKNVPSNIIVMCSLINGWMESDAEWAGMACEFGWKLRMGESPLSVPAWMPRLNAHVLLDDGYSMEIVNAEDYPRF